MGFGLYIPIRAYPRGKNQVPTGMVREWRLSRTSLCVPSKTCTKISRPLFFLTAVKFLYIRKALFFHGRFFLFFTATTAVGRAFFFHFRDVRFTCMFFDLKVYEANLLSFEWLCVFDLLPPFLNQSTKKRT